MGNVIADITMSLDGFVTGPDDRPGRGLGERGECLHNWVMGGPWRYDDQVRRFAPAEVDRKVLDQAMGSIGAGIIGRRMFDVTGGWGGNPPGGPHARYFVLTHAVPPEWAGRQSPFTFVTDSIRGALAQARAVAGDKDVGIGGGANVIQQYLAAGLVDDLRLHVAPVLLGAGKRLFDNLGDQAIELERTSVIESPYVPPTCSSPSAADRLHPPLQDRDSHRTTPSIHRALHEPPGRLPAQARSRCRLSTSGHSGRLRLPGRGFYSVGHAGRWVAEAGGREAE